MESSLLKLAALRGLMKKNRIDVYVVPSSDPHISEYIPDNWKIIQWLTGFTGSAGTVCITESFAGLWTDSRYFIQASQQLKDSGFVLINSFEPRLKDFNSWLAGIIEHGSTLGLDGRIFSTARVRRIQNSLKGIKVKYKLNCDLFKDLWAGRPQAERTFAFEHSLEFCGAERDKKIADVRAMMNAKGADYHLLTSLDDVMWLLNIRGRDIKYSPLLISFALIGSEQVLFFTDEAKIPLKMATAFDRTGVVMLPYEEIGGILSTLENKKSILLDPETTSYNLFNSLPVDILIIEEPSITGRLKAVKNKVEIENIGKAMVRDGVALTRFFFWLEKNLSDSEPDECMLADKLEKFRAEGENFLSSSFPAIVAFNENGALPHYSPVAGSCSKILADGILLVDSGAQYLDGTTDITRTIATGKVTPVQKNDFTLVLKGMIAVASAKFPEGTKGFHLDILARKALWEKGFNYGHGTGHGVGFCLNVHEGPANISPVQYSGSDGVLRPGMLLSDEPGLYREGEYGIRTENLVICYEDEETEFGKFLRFDTVSLCYIDTKLIVISLLTKEEINWLNDYHSTVYDKLKNFLSPEEKTWLMEKTSPLSSILQMV